MEKNRTAKRDYSLYHSIDHDGKNIRSYVGLCHISYVLGRSKLNKLIHNVGA